MVRKENLRFEMRFVRQEEAEEAAEIERRCFPPNEACSPERMKRRICVASDFFLVAIDPLKGKMVGFVNGIATQENKLRDEFFTDESLHDPDGPNIMILGVAVLPEYRGQGLARELVSQYRHIQRERNRRKLVLTCLEDKVEMYEKFGFRDQGESGSAWGGETWHEMEDDFMMYRRDEKRTWLEDEDGKRIAYLDHPEVRPGVVNFEHTIVVDAYSGRGMAGELTKTVAEQLRKDGIKAELSCSYSIQWFAKHPEYADVLADPEAEAKKAQMLAGPACGIRRKPK